MGGGFDTQASPASMPLANGTATFTIPPNTLNFNVGFPTSDTLTASYQGDSNYAQATASKAITVSQSVYSLTGTGPSGPVTPGTAASATVAVASTPNTNYTGTVTFTSASCVLSGYPTGVTSSTPGNPTCTLSGSGAVTVANGVPSGSATFAIHTDSATNLSELRRPAFDAGTPSTQLAKLSTPANPRAPLSRGTELFGAGGAAFAALFLLIIPGGARKWSKMLGAILLIVALTLTIEGCGGGGASSGGNTTPTLPTPTVTVTPASTTIPFNAALNVTVAVSGSAGTATGGVTLSANSGSLSGQNATLTSGSATFTIPASTFAAANGGNSVTLTASYQGNTAYNPATGTAAITVDYVPTAAGTYTFTVTPASSSPALAVQPSTTFTVAVN